MELKQATRLVAGAAAGFALSALAFSQSAHAWNVTPTAVSFPNQAGLTVQGRLFKPAGNGPFPAVVMMHGCAGIFSNSDTTKGVANLFRDWGDRLVAQGYVALLVDSFTPRNAQQNQCNNGSAGTSEVSERPLDAYGALAYLSNTGYVNPDRVGLLGWSHGASSTLASMDRSITSGSPFKVGVAFYPGCGLYDAFGGISNSTWAPYAPVRILHGGDDALYQDGRCNTRVTRAVAQGAQAELTVYAGAKHSFDMAGVSTGTWSGADYSAKAAGDSTAMNVFNSRLR